ncbi:hypothetical protein NE848_05800 [Gramella jeungdoensis]|uniref:RES domain-containing protein n=1 Tax=Gramella jeungdoensis TaxID=708091 RepID=A0ABT0YZI0_9FLAO|nr:hypothetical protein [Gramella jeungdoensis]MCM8568881.1 hypothetical protein [Gramella jeungdoensis]
MSTNTFLDEYQFLKKHLPKALIKPEIDTFNKLHSDELFHSINDYLRANSEEKYIEADLTEYSKPSATSLNVKAEKFQDLYKHLFSDFNNDNIADPNLIDKLIEDLGRKAFGSYLPMHSHFENKRYPWGIYLFPQFILGRSQQLHNEIGKKLKVNLEDIKYAYSYAIFRHLLFHHQVERFSTKHEILTQTVNYKKYRKKVYDGTSKTKKWLEEALAEVAVLRSTHINNNVAMDKNTFQELYKYDLQSMPPGNRDYDCGSFGGQDEAQQYFASQVIQCKIEISEPSTSICTVNANENNLPIKQVPIYKIEFDIPERIRTPREIVIGV